MCLRIHEFKLYTLYFGKVLVQYGKCRKVFFLDEVFLFAVQTDFEIDSEAMLVFQKILMSLTETFFPSSGNLTLTRCPGVGDLTLASMKMSSIISLQNI